MNRTELKTYIMETYNINSDLPWAKYPDYEVFRHTDNRKWFALIMNIPKASLGLNGTDKIDIVNFKCNSIVAGSLRRETGFFPAYHMNKENWITVALDGSVSEEKIKILLDMSYNATASKVKKNEKAEK